MQEKKLFEYAVIRLVPRVEREEFLNAGVIMYCKDLGFLKALYKLEEKRLLAFAPGVDIKELEERLKVFQQVCAGGKNAGPIGCLSAAERFRWLTAARSTVVQVSPVHPGLCTDAEQTLKGLFEKLVL